MSVPAAEGAGDCGADFVGGGLPGPKADGGDAGAGVEGEGESAVVSV